MKSSNTIQIKTWAATVLLGAVLSGCAVLTVDVDVYKGALVNEEHVQMHQLVALTTAAKPLLVQLRDNLEWPDSDGQPPKQSTGKGSAEQPGWLAEIISPSACPATDSWYLPKYVKPPKNFVPEYRSGGRTIWEAFPFVKPLCHGFFTHAHARRVNDILLLYEDLDEAGEVMDQRNNCDDKVAKQDRAKLDARVATKGLDSLFKKPSIKNTKDGCPTSPANEGADVSQHILSHEQLEKLVEFAQKVLFVANHDGLLTPPSWSGLVVGGLSDLNRALFGDALTDYKFSPYRLFQLDALDAKRTQYVRVLQAVGNSILFAANELRERERYRDQSQKKGEAEVAAVKEVYSPDPQKILHDLIHALRREQVVAQNQLGEATAQKAVIDGQMTDLRSLKQKYSTEQAKAELDRQNYLMMQGPLKAAHDLLTQKVIEKIKAQWTTRGKDTVADPAKFLTGPDGIEQELTTLRQELDGKEADNFDEGIKYVKSPEAKTAFEAYPTVSGHTSLKRSELLDALAAHLRGLEVARAARTAQDEKSVKEKEQAVRDVQDKITRMDAESMRLASVIASLPNTQVQLNTAATVIEALKAEVLKEAVQHDRFVSPDAVYLLLATHVKRKEYAETDANKKQPYQVALDILSRRTPPPGLPPLNPTDHKSPLTIMDDVIALLRHRQMMAVDRSGKGSDEDKKATEALENAYQHRASMVYIRPSSAYLRTSFPSTSLQDDPNLAWDNMLLKQGIRNLPFSSQLRDILDPSVERDRILTAELDKQYWQNINRVRVSGAGFTNQALVKDDVGNWYVKQYYGDTEKIVKSAKHLALYSLGAKLPIDLSRELGKVSVTKEESKKTEAEKEAELPPLQQVFGKHKAAYQTNTTDTATRLVALHGRDNEKTLYAKIVAEWKRDGELPKDADLMNALTVALEEEVAEWDTTLGPLKEASDQDRGLAIRKDLRALAKFEKQLSAQIHKFDKPEDRKVKAVKEVHRIVGRELINLLEAYKRALYRYEEAVLFIADAANPKDPKQEQGK